MRHTLKKVTNNEVIEEFAFPVRYRVFEGRSNAVLKPSCRRTLAVIATG